ncbi:protease SohB [Thiorhodovibrio frisius]|uniref:ClpP class periplasmic serine protease n=1 Tax=Thiorhodovibrio frisius TaxID=631362 RepID=H8Z507_9GAMM|nr:protease SohB [Thiorhodovibrio frisius]EIC20414.1 ClpP class periplasmic serine protease [Thiorhodovibrio frisius]WPL21155.1 putative protease SohB [Thiorhodovibrio frisius]
MLIEALIEYGLFAAKALTLMLALALLVMMLLRARLDSQGGDDGRLEITDLGERYRDMALGLKQAMLPAKAYKQLIKAERKADKARAKETNPEPEKRRIFVVDFHGDIMASEVGGLRELISALLLVARQEDEVLVRLENTGGAVHEHGLGASQLLRLRQAGIALTVSVDKVAASGGYLMAVVANRILAAPFAVIGSIGVVAELPNFHRWLQRNGIDFELHTAGEHKRTLTLFGENTEEARVKVREQLEDVHRQFKSFLLEYRPDLPLEEVATGEYWHGEQALTLGLVDELRTSDDYLLAAREEADLYLVNYQVKKKPLERLLGSLQLKAARWRNALR